MADKQQVGNGKELLQAITQLAGLLAALAAVVYGAGAIVLSLRLAFEHFPWSSIVSGLPREFVITTGAGQVLLPSLAVGAVYALYRALRENHEELKRPQARPGAGWKARGSLLLRYLLTMGLMLAPLAVILAVRGTDAVDDLDVLLGAALVLLLALAAMAVQKGRAVVARHVKDRRWNQARAVAMMAGLYTLAAMPAMVLSSAATPFSSAKVCMGGGTEEIGKLIGESGDRVYLGEDANTAEKAEHRRILVIPVSRVEQLFVGPHPVGAICES